MKVTDSQGSQKSVIYELLERSGGSVARNSDCLSGVTLSQEQLAALILVPPTIIALTEHDEMHQQFDRIPTQTMPRWAFHHLMKNLDKVSAGPTYR